jgi:hypothetical protein
MDRLALLRKSAQANMAQRVRESIGSAAVRNHNGRLSSMGADHGSSMYNFAKDDAEGGF